MGISGGAKPLGAVTYSYDADGIRKSKSADGVFTEYLTDKNRPFAQVLAERDGDTGALLASYTYGDDLISQTRQGVTSYYHYDGQMSTRQLTDDPATGPAVVTDTYTYDAFGNLINDEQLPSICGVKPPACRAQAKGPKGDTTMKIKPEMLGELTLKH